MNKKGSKLTRTEIVQVRLDPKLRFAVELAAAKDRRTLSSFIEMAVQKAVKEVELTAKGREAVTAADVAERVWDIEPADCLLNLAEEYPYLLTSKEARRWKLIQAIPEIYKDRFDHQLGLTVTEKDLPLLRLAWPLICEHADSGTPLDTNEINALRTRIRKLVVAEDRPTSS
jgi:hypothetical protein